MSTVDDVDVDVDVDDDDDDDDEVSRSDAWGVARSDALDVSRSDALSTQRPNASKHGHKSFEPLDFPICVWQGSWFTAAAGGFSARGGKVRNISWLPNKAVTKSFKPKSFGICKNIKNIVCALSLRFWLLTFKPYLPFTNQLFTNPNIHNHTNSLQKKFFLPVTSSLLRCCQGSRNTLIIDGGSCRIESCFLQSQEKKMDQWPSSTQRPNASKHSHKSFEPLDFPICVWQGSWFTAAAGGFSTRGGKVRNISWLPNKAVTKSFKPKSFGICKNIKKYCLRLVSAILTFEFQTIRVYLPFTLNSVHKVLLPKQLFTNLIIHNHTKSLQKKCLPPRLQFPPPLLPRK